ncbi:MAG: hypothetical protein F6K00_01710 [Leptolyngbya sp. SIOISBB]|nr:hypothetical protein [Leptolyngbya sp. SIOISBB]
MQTASLQTVSDLSERSGGLSVGLTYGVDAGHSPKLMQSSLTDTLQSLFEKAAILLLSCVDDALIMALSKLGVSLPGLQCLSAVLVTLTVCFWLYRLLRFVHRRYRLPLPYIAS